MPKILSDDQIRFYHETGYVKVENVVPQRSIDLGRKVSADWVDRTVAGWVDEGFARWRARASRPWAAV